MQGKQYIYSHYLVIGRNINFIIGIHQIENQLLAVKFKSRQKEEMVSENVSVVRDLFSN